MHFPVLQSQIQIETNDKVSQTCDNCGAPLVGPFCASCGQKAHALNPTLRDVAHDLTHELLHVDGRIFATLRRLLFSPGYLTLEYFRGRRARWISPLRLYLTFSVLSFAFGVLPGSSELRLNVTKDDLGEINRTEINAADRPPGFSSPEELAETVREALKHWAPRVMFVLVPLFAALVGVAFRRTSSHYPHHLYFALHVHAAWFAAAAVVAAVQVIAGAAAGRFVFVLAMVYATWYFVQAIHVVYGLSLRRTLARAAFVGFCYWIAVTAAILAIILPTIFWR
jgi:uncharacterized protein DUF3667